MRDHESIEEGLIHVAIVKSPNVLTIPVGRLALPPVRFTALPFTPVVKS